MMELPENLEGLEYYDSLRVLRDEALSQSRVDGIRKSLGWISSGAIYARWYDAMGYWVDLHDRGVRILDRAIRNYPTTLRVFDQEQKDQLGITEFQMNLDNGQDTLHVYKTTLKGPSPIHHIGFMLRKLQLGRYEESVGASYEDRVRVFEELERGASGLFKKFRDAD